MPIARLTWVRGILRAIRASRNRLPNDTLSWCCGATVGAVVGKPANSNSSSSFKLSDNKSSAWTALVGESVPVSVAGVTGVEAVLREDLRPVRAFDMLVVAVDVPSLMTALMASTRDRMVHGFAM